jgi:uncharacterized protein (TIGR04551 family)
MTSLRLSHLFLGSVLVLPVTFAHQPNAAAQVQPGGLPQPGQPGPSEPKPEGPAEQAPTTPGALPTTPVLPPPKSRRKKFRIFELDGYFRLRGDWFKKLHQGFNDDPTVGGAPFVRPLGCGAPVDTVRSDACRSTLRSTNMRLRLEPTINVDEKASVHVQADVYDNFVLGSTPDGLFANGAPSPGHIPVGTFTPGGAPAQDGRNLDRDAVVLKRAWAEVMTPVGLLKFGRMPSHWGMGILANAGGYDPFTGGYDLDSDYGDTVDRLEFGTLIPGTGLRFVLATDWPSTAPTAAQSDIYANRYDGQPFDLDDGDDVYQWTVSVARLDSPADFQERRDQGKLAWNYGLYFVYRKQDFVQGDIELGEAPDPDASEVSAQYKRRGATIYTPDIWFRVGYGPVHLELEALAVIGSIEDLTELSASATNYDVRQFGGVARAGYQLADGDLELGFEAGFASGDRADKVPVGATNVRNSAPLPGNGDTTFNAFLFDFDYEVDLILFRELLGTVSNAIYFKPTLRYDISDRFTARSQLVWSLAHRKAGTPGDGSMYGLELDADLGYHNNGFFAGLAYGVLFPMSALDHPPGAFPAENVGKAETAQTFQARAVLKF